MTHPPSLRERVRGLLASRPTLSIHQVARILGAPADKVEAVIIHAPDGPIRGRPRVAPYEEIAALYRAMGDTMAVAQECRVPLRTVQRALGALGIPYKTTRQCPALTADLLRLVVLERRTVRQAADELGLPVRVARRRLQRAGAVVPKDDGVADEDVAQRYLAGASREELEEFYGLTPVQVRAALRRSGIRLRSKRRERAIVEARGPSYKHGLHVLDNPAHLASLLPEKVRATLASCLLRAPDDTPEGAVLPPHLQKLRI